ncbi:hypothetical protein Taro_018499, partial [Colocasia esculenta]|nr:hypothetical protein [Colocasia esculenta]
MSRLLIIIWFSVYGIENNIEFRANINIRQTGQGLMAAATSMEDKYRSHIHGEAEKDTHWKFGSPPNYDVVNKLFDEGRTRVWPPGSLEEKVQNLVKTWEMEMFHKIRPQDYKTVDPESYTLSLNGRKPITLEEKRKLGGGYNSFMQTSLPEQFRCYDPAKENAETSHKAFTTAFPRGFALEIVQVYTGPPVIVYKFRHWGFMEGSFKGHAPTGEMVEFFGVAIFQVNNEMTKIEKVEFFFDRGELLGALLKGRFQDNQAEPSGCPFIKSIFVVRWHASADSGMVFRVEKEMEDKREDDLETAVRSLPSLPAYHPRQSDNQDCRVQAVIEIQLLIKASLKHRKELAEAIKPLVEMLQSP